MTGPTTGPGHAGVAAGPTRAEALRALRSAFAEAGVSEAALDARVLLVAALGVAPADIVTNPSERLTAEQAATLAAYRDRRIAREPVARILGEREFWGLPFSLSRATLVPRPDTETIVETALGLLANRQTPWRIADLGTGSGALLIALLHELPNAVGIGVDRSLEAARTARLNARRNGVSDRSLLVVSDWCAALGGRFDLIVSNPPYIATAVFDSLEAEVRDHDPALALDGGADGLEAYRSILSQAGELLAPDGHLVLEIGFDQEEALKSIAAALGFTVARFAVDLAGLPRCLALKRT